MTDERLREIEARVVSALHENVHVTATVDALLRQDIPYLLSEVAATIKHANDLGDLLAKVEDERDAAQAKGEFFYVWSEDYRGWAELWKARADAFAEKAERACEQIRVHRWSPRDQSCARWLMAILSDNQEGQ